MGSVAVGESSSIFSYNSANIPTMGQSPVSGSGVTAVSSPGLAQRKVSDVIIKIISYLD